MPHNIPLKLYTSLTRKTEVFHPVHQGQARVYSCGPTVYNYPHIGNMRAYVFADVLGRALSYRGLRLIHVINITDVGHLTDDADAGEDKLEKAAAAEAKTGEEARTIWDIARHYTEAYWADIKALNIREPAHWSIATDYVPAMIAFAEKIAEKHCYELDSGLYFDVSTIADYGTLARQKPDDDGEGRIDAVEGKRHPADFAIWRKTPAGEKRQMEWDSPWGRGAPGWHLECSVMSEKLLGLPFDIHTGGIDHREIHHPNEIAQNQAFCGAKGHACGSGARIWMHNNFLIDRTGKMSKSSGEFLRLPLLVSKGVHPLAYRLMCLQAHYRSELEFSWDNLDAALTRLKRLVMGAQKLKEHEEERELSHPLILAAKTAFDEAIADDLNTPKALTVVEQVIAMKKVSEGDRYRLIVHMDEVLGLDLLHLKRESLRIRPDDAQLTRAEVAELLDQRKAAREAKDFERSDELRDELNAKGIELMDGDPLGWEWRLSL